MYKFSLLMIIPLLAFAEPGPVTRQLMEEPASLFDIGMLRLEHSIGNWEQQIIGNYLYQTKAQTVTPSKRHSSHGNVNINYDPITDKIYIHLSMSDAFSTRAQMQAGCQSGFGQIAIIVGKSGSAFFQHHRGVLSSTSSSFDVAISTFYEFRCYVYGNDSSKGRFWATQSPGSEMKIGRWPLSN